MNNSGNVECVLKLKMDDLLGNPNGYTDHSDLLFHYTKAETALSYILRWRTIKFNALKNTNDPLETRPLTHVGIRNKPSVKDSPSVASELRTSELNDERQKGKVACFCISKAPQHIGGWFDWGCFRPTMWSQYADGHKGVCLVFSKRRLLEAMDEWTQAEGLKDLKGPVGYDNKLKKLKGALTVSSTEAPTDRIKHHSEGYYFCKHEDYQNESEYRAVVYNQKLLPEEVKYMPYKNSLRGVLLGANFPHKENDLFIKKARSLGIALAQVERYSNYCLHVVEPCWHQLDWKNWWCVLFRLKHKISVYFKYRRCGTTAQRWQTWVPARRRLTK